MKLLGLVIALDVLVGGAAVWVIAANESCAGCEQNVSAMLIAYGALAALAVLTAVATVGLVRRRR